MLEVKYKLNVNGVKEEIADCGNVHAAALQETPDVQLDELREDKLIDINDKNDCDKKDEDVPEEVTPAKNFQIKGTLTAVIFHDNENTKNKMLETDPHLEWSMTIHQGINKTVTLYLNLHDEKKACAVQTTLNFFSKK